MKKKIYRIIKLGDCWHLQESNFRKPFYKKRKWLTVFPYSRNRDDVVDLFSDILKINKNSILI
ncbi:hypothetical protein HYO65_gp122 [Tenacibaculum phage PTm1]|uniref:Uncharacterized protein n=2 Tax=Shirahamavirus PTm1 TaxID=2846435 RepID=A0A5S9HXJ7_9CAUD|nr:hypothetical protein HYO65_gp122 [Tenacibaculum phage PTm1]BBI90514.1 hypothetical protein [Tenacibaculum phage PTm1]BBI90822.1 hypothetical protein [Tenacibaculum phage PTm5]